MLVELYHSLFIEFADSRYRLTQSLFANEKKLKNEKTKCIAIQEI